MSQEPLDISEGFEDTPPEDVETTRFDYKALTFGERLARIREDRGYIQKMTRQGMGYSAVWFDDLVEQVRPLFIRYGVSWHTHRCELVTTPICMEFSGMLVTSALMIYVVRFQCVEGPSANYPYELVFRDVTVPATAFDAFDPGADEPRGDTGAGKATTYAQKYALRMILNLAAGEDPDFTPMMSLSTRAQEERTSLVARLESAIKLLGFDPDTEIAKLINTANTQHSRAIESVRDMDTTILRQWVTRAEDKVKETANETV